MRKIKMTLDNIDDVLKRLEEYRAWINQKCAVLVERLCERGVEIAKELCPVDTGDLRNSIHSMAEDMAGQIIASASHAAYVEFGTGIVGSMSPHPTLPWIYDINAHSFDGWTYFKNGQFHWTAGQPAKPFMHNTAQQLANEAPKIAREVFSEKH